MLENTEEGPNNNWVERGYNSITSLERKTIETKYMEVGGVV